VPRGVARDPNIKKHSPEKLRRFASAFDDTAARLREQALAYEQKAVRYRKRADKVEKDNTHGS